MKNKRTAGFLIVYVIILAMYNVVFFLLPFEKNASAVTEYVFTLVSIILGAAITLISLGKSETIKSKLYGFPIFKIGICYTAIQTVFGLAVCIIGFWFEVPIYISVIVSVLILGFALIGVIAADAAKDIIERQERTDAAAIQNISALISDMKGISEQSTDPALKARLLRARQGTRAAAKSPRTTPRRRVSAGL